MINFTPIKFKSFNYKNMHVLSKSISFKGIDRDTIYINKRNDIRYEENSTSPRENYKPFISEDEMLIKIREKNQFLKDFATFAKYSGDFKRLAGLTYRNGEHIFKRKSCDNSKMMNSLYSIRKDVEFRHAKSPHQIDYDSIQSILNVKYSNPENEKPINKLLGKLQNGEISSTQLKMYSYMLYSKTLAPETINKLSDNGFSLFRNEVSSWDRVLDEEKLANLYDTEVGDKLFALKQKMGREFYLVKWCDLINDKTTEEEISAIVDDVPKLYKREQLKLKLEDFYIRMNHFGKNIFWAERMCQISDYATELIRNGESFEFVLNTISEEAAEVNFSIYDGINQSMAENFGEHRNKKDNVSTIFDRKRHKYGEYAKKFKKLTKGASNKTYKVTTPMEFSNAPITKLKINTLNGEMLHPSGDKSFLTLHYVKGLYDKIMNSKNKGIIPLNENIAKMHWVFAHGMPFKRGSDSIANILVKSIYRANDVKVTGAKEGISFDLEAFSTELNEYVENYPYLYDLPPRKIN